MKKFKGSKGELTISEPGHHDGHFEVFAGKTLFARIYGNGQAEANARLVAASKEMAGKLIVLVEEGELSKLRENEVMEILDKAL